MATEVKFSLPRFLVLKSNGQANYMGNITDNGYARFMETQPVSPYAKFEVETSANGLVHIRSCQNNKYLVRTQNLSITNNSAEHHWITATALKPEEDQSKESCTLFKPIPVDLANNTVRIMHVQSGCYLRIWSKTNSTYNHCVLASYASFDSNKMDVFKIINRANFVIIPRYVVFKGDNENYLFLSTIQNRPYLQFGTTDRGDVGVACETFYTDDGNIRIKTLSNNKFWRYNPAWIHADSSDTSGKDKDTLFRPVQVDDETIALLCLSNNRYCKRLTTDGKTSCLNAAVTSITTEARLKVEEAVMTREYYNLRYDLDNGRVYDENPLVVARNFDSNYTQQASTLDVKLQYNDTKTSTWRNNISLKLGAKVTTNFGVPAIFSGTLEMSGEFGEAYEWGETNTNTTVVEIVSKVTVPPMTKATVSLIATNGKCDVPIKYTQRDTLYNGTVITTDVVGAVYTGSNYYNFEFQTKEEKLTTAKLTESED